MAQGKFSAQVSAWCAETKSRMRAVRNEAIERTVAIAQTPVAKGGNMPVDTGFLRSSLRISRGAFATGSLPNPNPKAPKGTLDNYDPGSVTLILLQTPIEEPIYAVYTAAYARYQEYGTSKMPGRRFVGLAAQRWPQIVAEVAAEAEALVRSRAK
jgi:hypothetical protein